MILSDRRQRWVGRDTPSPIAGGPGRLERSPAYTHAPTCHPVFFFEFFDRRHQPHQELEVGFDRGAGRPRTTRTLGRTFVVLVPKVLGGDERILGVGAQLGLDEPGGCLLRTASQFWPARGRDTHATRCCAGTDDFV